MYSWWSRVYWTQHSKKLSSHDYEVLIIDSLAVNNYNSLSSDNIPNPNLSKFILDKNGDD